VRTGLAEYFFPELPDSSSNKTRFTSTRTSFAHLGGGRQNVAGTLLRLAALFHDIAKPNTRSISEDGVTFRFHDVVGARMTRQRMTALKYSQDTIENVASLVELHLRFHTYKLGWSDRAVRRYVRDAGDCSTS
jgi:poly(A) polymerase